MERKLVVKTGCCTRLMKEVKSYENELEVQKKKVDQYKAEERDPYEIKQQENVLQETEQVLPDSIRRLGNALEQLEEFIEDNEDKLDCAQAKDIISETSKFLEARSARQLGKL